MLRLVKEFMPLFHCSPCVDAIIVIVTAVPAQTNLVLFNRALLLSGKRGIDKERKKIRKCGSTLERCDLVSVCVTRRQNVYTTDSQEIYTIY
jgi:hypothetical protein